MHVLVIVGEGEIHIKPLYLVLMKNQLGNVKQCRTLIKHHHVFVNGICVQDIHYLVQPQDNIVVDGKKIVSQPFVYIMIHKPKGYICANKDDNHACIVDLIPFKDCFCIGRLDLDTTGLLLMTNDPSLSKTLLLPERHIEKTYFVKTQKALKNSLVKMFSQGIIIDKNVQCRPAQIEFIDEYHCYVTLYEGKYHQIKKMFLSCDNQVVELKRVTFAGLSLDCHLQEGEFRHLNNDELQLLQALSI